MASEDEKYPFLRNPAEVHQVIALILKMPGVVQRIRQALGIPEPTD